MSNKHKVHHAVKNKLWIKPEIDYDTWLSLKEFGKPLNLEFPAVVDMAAAILTNPTANKIASLEQVPIEVVYHKAIELYLKKGD